MRIDLETRELTENTVSTYLRYAGRFIAEVGVPVRKVTRDDVRQYLLHAAPIVISVEQRGGSTDPTGAHRQKAARTGPSALLASSF